MMTRQTEQHDDGSQWIVMSLDDAAEHLKTWIDNIDDPSATVGADFRSVMVILDRGRVLNRVDSEQNEQTISLLSAQ